MSPDSRREYRDSIKQRYHLAPKAEKGQILNEFCQVTGYNRKYAIRVLNKKDLKAIKKKRRGRKRKYTNPLITIILYQLWKWTNLPCSKRLKAIIPIWLPFYPSPISRELYEDLCAISPSTIDRLMKNHRSRYMKMGLSTTQPGTILKKQIPIATNKWDQRQPGFIEADTVAHCGSSVMGSFVYTINCVDIATQWTEQFAIWGKGETGVLKGLININKRLPFDLRGFDCDNGSEFLNWPIQKHYLNRKRPVNFTRSRPYYKNDNAYIEQNNWTHIRQLLGYARFGKPELVGMLNDLYENEWRLLLNFFIPYVKLLDKTRQGSKTTKKYDPLTPIRRTKTLDIPRIHTISESAHRIHNPFTPEKLATLGAALRMHPGTCVLDLGCGSGEMLCTWARDFGITGTGIDMSPLFTEQAKVRAEELGVVDQVTFIHGDAAGYVAEEKVGVAACVGATWIGGGVAGTIELLARSLDPGGVILIGEPYWRQLPPTEEAARACLAGAIADFLLLPELLASFGHLGYDVVEMVLADQDSWDRYEAAKWLTMRRWLEENPDDDMAKEVRANLSSEPVRYATYTREYLGWGVFALMKQ